MPVTLPSEQGGIPLDLDQTEAIFRALWRAPVSVTLAADTLTIPGSGRYTILPQTGLSDQVTSIVLTGEAVIGTLIQVHTQTDGHVISFIHGGNIHLNGGISIDLSTIYSSFWLRHMGSNVWTQDSLPVNAP